jgi:hypothetical protein
VVDSWGENRRSNAKERRLESHRPQRSDATIDRSIASHPITIASPSHHHRSGDDTTVTRRGRVSNTTRHHTTTTPYVIATRSQRDRLCASTAHARSRPLMHLTSRRCCYRCCCPLVSSALTSFVSTPRTARSSPPPSRVNSLQLIVLVVRPRFASSQRRRPSTIAYVDRRPPTTRARHIDSRHFTTRVTRPHTRIASRHRHVNGT